MTAKHIAVPSCNSRFAHARYGSQMIDRFLYWGDHRNQKSGDIKGSCRPHCIYPMMARQKINKLSFRE